MTVQIDATKPADGTPASKATLRANLAAAKTALGTMRISVTDFPSAIVADGEVDSSAGLIAMRDEMKADRNKLWKAHFEPGHYVYENNRWLLGIGRADIEATGATFECISVSGESRNYSPLQLQTPFDAWGDQPYSSQTVAWHLGHLFASANVGDRTVTLKTASEVAEFGEGEIVLVGGYDQQFGGWGPNLRYVEFKRVASVGADSVTFTTPLQNDYDERWWDTTDTIGGLAVVYGKPRLYRCNRSEYNIIEHLKMRGGRFIWNRNQAAVSQQQRSFVLSGIMDAALEDFLLPDMELVAAAMRRLVTTGGRLNTTELDKTVEEVWMDGTEITNETSLTARSIGPATGVGLLSLRNTRLCGAIDAAPRVLHMDNVQIIPQTVATSAISRPNGHFGSRAWHIGNLRLVAPQGHALTSWIDVGDFSFAVDSVGAGNEISLTDDADAQNAVAILDIGHEIATADGAKRGQVTALYYDAGKFVIETDAKASWEVADKVFTLRTQQLDVGAVEPTDAQIPLLNTLSGLTRQRRKTMLAVRSSEIALPGVTNFTWTVQGRIVEVRCNVEQSYSGSDLGPQLRLFPQQDGSSNEIARIDLLTTGYRRINQHEALTLGADTTTQANFGLFATSFQITHQEGGNSISGTVDEMPEYTLEVDFVP